jgi:two-component system LytT family response regulator
MIAMRQQQKNLEQDSDNMSIFNENSGGKMLRTLIIDDEAPVRNTLAGLLARTCPQVKVVGEADGVKTGLRAIREKSPDLVLLDIKMDDGTGFDLLNQFDNISFRTIFVTAYGEFALRAFEFAAVDYLLKPVNPEKLVTAVDRAFQLKQKEFNIQLEALRENEADPEKQNKKIILKTHESIFLCHVNDIIHCSSDGSYTVFDTVDGQHIMVSKILKEYESLLSGSGFLRIHRSHLINLRHIKRFDRQDGGYVVMSNADQIPVSTSGRELLLELFKEIGGS